MRKIVKNILTTMMCAVMVLSSTTVTFAAESAQFSVDGEVAEWTNVKMQTSNDSRIAKWAVAQDENNYYFYVQQNGGNKYGLPITETNFSMSYADGSQANNTSIRFTYMLGALKDAYYGDIQGANKSYKMSDEANKYEIEFSVPKSFFGNKEFTINYCGDKISSKDIVKTKDVKAPVEEEPVYEGIKVDGSFKDWAAVSKIKVEKDSLVEVAMVFDGDYVYIYMKETSDGALTHSGEKNNGAFTIYTDLGRDTVFKLDRDKIVGIDGAKVSHSNLQYEIAIPVSEIKQYKETISFGYFMDKEMLIENVANINEDKDRDTSFNEIVYDGSYLDWSFYPHQLVQYSSPGSPISDAEAALYQKDAILYGHVKTYLNLNTAQFKDITLAFNEDKEMNLTLVAVDAQGNINRSPQLSGLKNGSYEYYLWDRSSGVDAKNINDKNAPIYGKITVTVGASHDEMEYYVELEKIAKELKMDVTDMKLIQAKYINIGNEWVSIAGTSSGPIFGIILSIAVAGFAAFMLDRKSKKQTKVD